MRLFEASGRLGGVLETVRRDGWLIERSADMFTTREPWGLDEMWLADPDGLRIGVVEVPPEHPLRRDPRP